MHVTTDYLANNRTNIFQSESNQLRMKCIDHYITNNEVQRRLPNAIKHFKTCLNSCDNISSSNYRR